MATGIIGPGMASAQTSLLQAQESRMLKSLQAGKTPSGDDKIAKGARQFEAMLLSSWLQQAEKSLATVPGADENEDDAGGDQMMNMGVQNLADSMAASGGIGLGAMISRAMHATADAANPSAAPHNSEKF